MDDLAVALAPTPPENPRDRELTPEEVAARRSFIEALPVNDARRQYMDILERAVAVYRQHYPIQRYAERDDDTGLIARLRDMTDRRDRTDLLYLTYSVGYAHGRGPSHLCNCVYSVYRHLIAATDAELNRWENREQEELRWANRMLAAVERHPRPV